MAKGYYKALAEILSAFRYRYKENAKGAHETWEHEETGRIQIVPNPCKSRHTANAICKDIGAGKRF